MSCDPSVHFIHVWGLPWELSDAASALETCLPAGTTLLEPPLLPLDRKARATGRALMKVTAKSTLQDVLASLEGRKVGDRHLEARCSNEGEYTAQRRGIETTIAKANMRAPQHYSMPEDTHASIVLPSDARDIAVLCHETRSDVASGAFDLNNLPCGRVDVLARCVSAALFLSHGVRQNVRLWLLLRDVGLTVCLDGARAKGLHPDERTIGSAIKRTLRSWDAGDAAHTTPLGWSVFADKNLEDRLRYILNGSRHAGDAATGFVVCHELGVPLTAALAAKARGTAPSTLLVLGDHQGFSVEEEACFERCGGIKAQVSPVPLLASHCIVLAHAVLDTAAILNLEGA